MIVGFIGFGEVSFHFAQSMMEYGNLECIAYDINYESAQKRAADVTSGKIEIIPALEDFLSQVNVVFVAVPGKFDESLFQEIAMHPIKEHLFIDFSTALPNVKQQAEKLMIAKNASYVDAAVMGSVPKLRHKTPLMVSGNGSTEMLKLFRRFEMDILPVGDKGGNASTIKLCRSIFMKGLPALIIETQRVCEKYQVSDQVFRSIYHNFEDQTFSQISDRLVSAAFKHAVRQRDEVEECIVLAQQAGIRSVMCEAARDIFNSIVEEDVNGKQN